MVKRLHMRIAGTVTVTIVAFSEAVLLQLLLYRVGHELDASVGMEDQTARRLSPGYHPLEHGQYVICSSSVA